MKATVELYENPQSILAITFPFVASTPLFLNPDCIVTPEKIKTIIKNALAEGWKPSEKSKPFSFIHHEG